MLTILSKVLLLNNEEIVCYIPKKKISEMDQFGIGCETSHQIGLRCKIKRVIKAHQNVFAPKPGRGQDLNQWI